MTKKMLIDSTHDEETRVAVVDGKKLVEFDYESKFRKPLKGSIFLAKVTRVEPSLQAAFVNFGGNRHGFLPFSEIHPDYFRIPIADREALLAEQQAMIEEQEAAEREREAREQEHQQQGGSPSPEFQDTHSEDGAPEEITAPASEGEEPDEDNVEYLEREDETIEEIGGAESLAASKPAQEEHHDDVQAVQDEEFRPLDNSESHEEHHDDDAQPEDGQFDGQNEGGEPSEGQDGEGQSGERQEGGEEGGRGGRGGRFPRRGRRGGGRGRHRMAHRSNRVEKFGGEDYSQDDKFRFNLRRKYKIQEVIKRGQIMLVQVSKEERGNKGAAVSTYLSLPGRYCVLMPNSPRAGGVSRKIANYQDRARMKEIMQEIKPPTGMSVIVRTAGVSRTKPEINRDLDYLMRLWDNIRELTLQSSAPAKVYEEADLIKRAVRDLYGKDIEEIIVAGDEGYKNAKNFMKMMIPSHVKRVIEHTEEVPLFTRYHVEEQIAEIGEARVTLPSGGYLIINQTEALVAVDVNSGKATKERHIEETALKTNMEAASEIARQLRLRDLGGLIVIDFIDMEDRRNNSKVERRVREALSNDRARIQMSRISSFGLMELSRQRLNPSLTESQFEICPHCAGLGRIRTSDAMSIMVLRAIEAEGIKGRKGAQIIAHVSNDVAVYLLNNKRKNVTQIEARYGVNILIRVDESVGASSFRIEVIKPAGAVGDDDELPSKEVHVHHVHQPVSDHDHDDDEAEEGAEPSERPMRGERQEHGDRGPRPDRGEGEGRGRRRGRRGGRNRGRREWRDRDDNNANGPRQDNRANGPSDAVTNDSVGNQIGNEFFADDEFEDAAAHQALHDQEVIKKRENEDFNPAQPRHRGGRHGGGERQGGDRNDRGGRGGRGRGGRGRGGRDRNDRGPRPEGNRDGNREGQRNDNFRDNNRGEQGPRRERPEAIPQVQQQQQSAPQMRDEGPRAEGPRSEPRVDSPRAERPKPENRDYEKVNVDPGEKKRGWWNRLTE